MALMTVVAGWTPPGSYQAVFTGVHPFQAGPALRWAFMIAAGPRVGTVVSRITSAPPTPDSPAGRLLSGFLGRPVREGESIDPDQFVGRRYTIELRPTRDGAATHVESVAPAE